MSSPTSTTRLFKPVKLGGKHVIHRVAMAPLTRLRAAEGTKAPKVEIVPTYYTQRASPGTLLVTEATFIAYEASGYPLAPGIYSSEQVSAWKQVTEGVHKKGGFIYSQLWALGRAHRDPPLHGYQEDVKTVSASPIAIEAKYGGMYIVPEEMTPADIQRYIGHYKQAALNAIEAGFDGVEIHGANGYLIDQFTQSVSNHRTDNYGGSVEKRCRFAIEVVEAVAGAIGAERTGIRLSPWGTFQDMQEPNPFIPFTYLIEKLTQAHPKLSYIHCTEAREWAPGVAETKNLEKGVRPTNDPFRAILRGIDPKMMKDDDKTVFPDPDENHPTLFITASGYKDDNSLHGAIPHCERTGDVVAFGRHFISNPDLPQRIKAGIPLTHYDRSAFYTHEATGYIDYHYAKREGKGIASAL